MKSHTTKKYRSISEFAKLNFNHIIVIILASVIAGFLLNIFILLSSILYVNDFIVFITSELSILLSLCIIPYVFFKKIIYKNLKLSEKKITLITFIIIAILISLIYIDLQTSIHFMIIAISEEILFREIYHQYLLGSIRCNNKRMNTITTMLITSFVFATILHINENFFINIIIRFPLGVLLFIIRDKFKLRSAIIVHWIYNIIITTGV